MDYEKKPINKKLIVFTFFVTSLGWIAELKEPVYFSAKTANIIWVITILLTPLFVMWTKALWNNIIPRITNLREIDFWEAFGISVFLFFMF